MAKEPHKVALVYASGRVEQLKDGVSWHGVIDHVHQYMSGAGSGDSPPKMVIHNGKVVFDGDLYQVAWQYSQAYQAEAKRMKAALDAQFVAPWEEKS